MSFMDWGLSTLLQDAVGATGDGAPLPSNGRGGVNIFISGTFVGTVTFEASHDNSTFFAIPALNRTTEVSAATATAQGLYYLDLQGINFVRARISAYTSGNITATAVLIPITAPPNKPVTLNAGDIEIGAVELKNASDDTRAKIGALSGLVAGDNGIPVTDPIANAVLGVTTGTKVVTDANGTIQQYLRGLITFLANALGAGTAAAALRTTLANNSPGAVELTNFGAGEYETVAASQTAQVLGATGAIGDYISGLLVIPATVDPGNVLLLDNATSITVFAGGTASVSNLVPFFIPLGMKSASGAFKVTTGANVSVIGIGNFS